MTGQEPTKEVSEQLLTALHGELASRGVSCDLQDNPGHPSRRCRPARSVGK
jgi:hypothetical protein